MPKSILVDPKEVKKPEMLKIDSIPVNQYKSDFKAELAKYGTEGLSAMYHDMVMIREFETMLHSIKMTGSYQGIEYDHRGLHTFQ